MVRSLQTLSGILITALLIGAPIAYALHVEHEFRNFRVVREGVLYRSGQLTLDGLKRIVNDYGIRYVITLRDSHVPGEPPPDLDDEEFCRAEEIAYCRIPPAHWWSSVPPPPAEEGVRKFRAIMADPRNYPVLIHCCAGVHRTGVYCAVYRMEFEHWSNAAAITELEVNGYENLPWEWDVLTYLEEYRPAWKGPPDPPPAPVMKKGKPRRKQAAPRPPAAD
jgi:protein tyrosine/serine phosphatase